MTHISIEEMCLKMDEALDADNKIEDKGLLCTHLYICQGLYWAAQILRYINQTPSAWSMAFPYAKELTVHEAADGAVRMCVDIIVDAIKLTDGFDKCNEIDLHNFCRVELLSCFSGIYSEDDIIDLILYRFDSTKMRGIIGSLYPIDLLRTIIGMFEYAHIFISPEAGEVLLANYLKHCLVNYKDDDEVFSEVYCTAIGHCALKLRPDFLMEIYDMYISHVNKLHCLLDYTNILYIAALHFSDNGSVDKALDMMQEVLQIRILEIGEHHAAVGSAYCQISINSYKKRRFDDVITNAIKAYEAFPKTEQDVHLGWCLVYLVHTYHDMGQYEKIPKWLAIVSDIYQKNKDQPEALGLFLELCLASGNYFFATMQLVIAEMHYNTGISTATKHDPSNEILERLKNNLAGMLASFVGDIQAAEDLLSEYITDSEPQVAGKNILSLMYANAAHISGTSKEMEQYARQAYDAVLASSNSPNNYYQKLLYARALLINQKHESHMQLIIGLVNESEDEIKRLYFSQENAAMNIAAREAITMLYACKAHAALMFNDYEMAEYYAKAAVIHSEKNEAHYEICLFCGQLLYSIGKNKSALLYFNNALSAALSRLDTAKKYLNESRVRDYLQGIRVVANHYFSFETHSDVTISCEDMYDVVLKTKALPSLIEKVKKDTSIISDFPKTTHKDVHAKLPPSSALIEYFEYCEIDSSMFHAKREDYVNYIWYAVFVTIKDADGYIDFARATNIDSFYVSETASALRKAIENHDHKQIAELKSALYDLILSNIHPYLEGCTEIYIAPDADLATVPFEILGIGGYLMDEYKIIYLETGRDVKVNSGQVDMNGASLVVGEPEYSIKGKRDANFWGTSRSNDEKSELPPLPMSRLEARLVAHTLKAQPILGKQATKYAILECESPKVIHIATHGSVDDLGIEDDRIPINPMTQSYLVMAGYTSESGKGNESPPYGNGKLTANEIAQKNLVETDLVVLSACATGLGKLVYSEVVGMRVAFKIAGAKNIIVSLWEVNDFATAVFMYIFYNNLQSSEIHLALWQTKRIMRSLTMKKLKEGGWFKESFIEKMGEAALIAEKYKKMNDEHMPFINERDWAGFICQQN